MLFPLFIIGLLHIIRSTYLTDTRDVSYFEEIFLQSRSVFFYLFWSMAFLHRRISKEYCPKIKEASLIITMSSYMSQMLNEIIILFSVFINDTNPFNRSSESLLNIMISSVSIFYWFRHTDGNGYTDRNEYIDINGYADNNG